jgi:hypothetical protein
VRSVSGVLLGRREGNIPLLLFEIAVQFPADLSVILGDVPSRIERRIYSAGFTDGIGGERL